MRAGDTVDTGAEVLVVAAVLGDQWVNAGYPENAWPVDGYAVVQSCSDNKHAVMVRSCLASTGRRRSWSLSHDCPVCCGARMARNRTAAAVLLSEARDRCDEATRLHAEEGVRWEIAKISAAPTDSGEEQL